MEPQDWPVWERFLVKYGPEIKNLYYNVRVGGKPLDTTNIAPEMVKMWFATTAKRIDAIAEFEKEIWLIEVADMPGLRAVGQLATYMTLYAEDPKFPLPAIAVLVATSIDPDLYKAITLYGMRAIQV
jgi:hypothetical protein